MHPFLYNLLFFPPSLLSLSLSPHLPPPQGAEGSSVSGDSLDAAMALAGTGKDNAKLTKRFGHALTNRQLQTMAPGGKIEM